MAIQHRNIADPEIHEPKGVASAASGTLYVANGSGSGTWSNPAPTSLSNTTANFSVAGGKLVVNANNGIGSEYGTMAASLQFTGNSTAASLTTSLSDAVGSGFPWVDGVNFRGTLDHTNGIITSPISGLYEIEYQFVLTPATGNGFRVSVFTDPDIGQTLETYHALSSSKKTTVQGKALSLLATGVDVSLQVASPDGSGNVTVASGWFSIKLLGEN